MPYMKYFCNGLTPEIAKRAEEELGETKQVRFQSIKELNEHIKNEQDFNPYTADEFLLRFLRKNKFNVINAFEELKKYYRFKARFSGIFTDFKPSDVRANVEDNHAMALEYRDQNDIGVCLIRNTHYDYKRFTPKEIIASFIVMSEALLEVEATSILGYSVILDLTDCNFQEIKQYSSPILLYHIITALKDYGPCRLRALHIVNEPYHFNVIYKIIRRFLPEKMRTRVFCHGNNLASLHEYITPEILPGELGGKQGTMAEFSKEFIDRVLKTENRIIEMNNYGYEGETLKSLLKPYKNPFQFY